MDSYVRKHYENGRTATSIYSAIFGTVGVSILATGHLEGIIPLLAGVPTGAMAMYCHKKINQIDLESKLEKNGQQQ